MILIRCADEPSDSAPTPSTGSAADIPRQVGPARPDAIDVGDIARKPRAVASALQKLYGI